MGTVDLRCKGNTLHGRATDGTGTIEVKCKRRRCGHRPGAVVLHTFDLHTGAETGTRIFAEPKNQKGESDASHSNTAAVRSA